MGLHRHYLDKVPGSEDAFGIVVRCDAQSVQGLAHLMLALTAETADAAYTELAAAKAAGISPESWAGWAIIKGARPAIAALTRAGVSWKDATYKDRPFIEWAVEENSAPAAKALLDIGFSPSQRLGHIKGAPFWLEHACGQRAFATAHVLLDALSPTDPERPQAMDRALWALSQSPGKHGHSNVLEDPEKWKLWRRLVHEGAAPFRLHAPDEPSSPEEIAQARAFWEPSLSPQIRAAWEEAGRPDCTWTPVHQAVRVLASRMEVHNPDARHAWKALDATVDWKQLPADGWGRDLFSVLRGERRLDVHSVSRDLRRRGCPISPDSSVVAVALLVAAEEYLKEKKSGFGRASSVLESWASWVDDEKKEGRPSVLPLDAASVFTRLTMPSRFALLSEVKKEMGSGGIPTKAPLKESVGDWMDMLSEHLLPKLAVADAAAWEESWAPVFQALETLRMAVADAKLDGSDPGEAHWKALVDACDLAATLPAAPARPRPRL